MHKSAKFFVLSSLLRLYIWFVVFTSRVKITKSKAAVDILDNAEQAAFLSMWHGKICLVPYLIFKATKMKPQHLYAVTSTHNDGQYVESLLQRFGIKAIRGSSNKGGVAAIQQILRAIQARRKIAITPDGPKGPRHACNGNIHVLSNKYQIPIIPICYASTRAKILNTWDRFWLPLPFSTIYIDFGAPFIASSDGAPKLINTMKEQENAMEEKAKISDL